jgi:hypothetical protein
LSYTSYLDYRKLSNLYNLRKVIVAILIKYFIFLFIVSETSKTVDMADSGSNNDPQEASANSGTQGQEERPNTYMQLLEQMEGKVLYLPIYVRNYNCLKLR